MRLAKGTALEEEKFEDIFKALSKEKQNELQDKHMHFAEKTGVDQGNCLLNEQAREAGKERGYYVVIGCNVWYNRTVNAKLRKGFSKARFGEVGT